jgi:asparagine synthetase B (glutamine-hydrolysing)
VIRIPSWGGVYTAPGSERSEMCGIIGGYRGMDSETASLMLAPVVHRGPDDEGRNEVAGNVLGHRRLSI